MINWINVTLKTTIRNIALDIKKLFLNKQDKFRVGENLTMGPGTRLFAEDTTYSSGSPIHFKENNSTNYIWSPKNMRDGIDNHLSQNYNHFRGRGGGSTASSSGNCVFNIPVINSTEFSIATGGIILNGNSGVFELTFDWDRMIPGIAQDYIALLVGGVEIQRNERSHGVTRGDEISPFKLKVGAIKIKKNEEITVYCSYGRGVGQANMYIKRLKYL